MQTVPLSRRTVQEIEDVIDLVREVVADGVITCAEIISLNTEIQEAYASAMETDTAQAAGISFIRNGINSQRSQRLARSLDGDTAA